ncbi:MAG TPA: hypothetical protein VGA53_03840 [Candidatus Paceibacterota bacterium]
MATAYIVVFDWEYELLKAEMGLIDQLLLSSQEAPAGLVQQGSVTAYLGQMVFWTFFLILLGLVWAGFLFPKRPLVEKIIFSLPFGVFVMPLAFVVPAWIISAGKVAGELFGTGVPSYYGPTVEKIVHLISSNQEQGYEIAAVLGFLIVGLLILGITKLTRKNGAIS